MLAPLLSARSLTKRYGGLVALDSLDLDVRESEIVGLIGPNGAGKTTCFNLLSGATAPTSGTVRFRGRDVTRASGTRRAREGITRTFQNIRLWSELTVIDNVRAVFPSGGLRELGGALLRLPSFRSSERSITRAARAALEWCGLAERADQRAGDLSYGDQRLLEIARALALEPSILLLDEPAAGMGAADRPVLMRRIQRLREERGLAILMIEHDMEFLPLCDVVYALDGSRRIAVGTPAQVRGDPRVLAAYLGDVD